MNRARLCAFLALASTVSMFQSSPAAAETHHVKALEGVSFEKLAAASKPISVAHVPGEKGISTIACKGGGGNLHCVQRHKGGDDSPVAAVAEKTAEGIKIKVTISKKKGGPIVIVITIGK